jgi:hypothetical protein
MINDIPRYLRLSPLRAFLLFVAIDVFCVGCGMGVPVFSILFGFLVGWYIIRWMLIITSDEKVILYRLMRYSWVTAMVTFVGMAIIWGWSIPMLFKSKEEIANFGLPLILYDPRASLIGWLILMIVISPFLQLLTTIFAGHLTLLLSYRKKEIQNKNAQATA